MGLPGGFNPKGEDWLVRLLADIERRLQQLAAANPFAAMGIRPMKDGLIVDGYETVNGPLTVNGRIEVNDEMDVSGNTEFKGNMKVSGTLDLPKGIIGNDALTDPLVVETSGVSQNNFAVGASTGTFAFGSVAIPAGYTRAAVLCMVVGGAMNSTGSMDYLYVSAEIAGDGGGESPQPAAAGGYASTSANGIRTLTGLNGGAITLGCRIRTNSGTWAASTATFANMNAVIYFTR